MTDTAKTNPLIELLITLITPVLALMLGNLFNGERITPSLGIGTALILLGLAAHQHDALLPMLRRSRRGGSGRGQRAVAGTGLPAVLGRP